MKTGSIVVLIVAAATAIGGISLWRQSLPNGGTEKVASDSATPVTPPLASASAGPSSTNGDNRRTEARAIDPAWRTPSTPSPRYAEPEDIERQLAQFIAEQPGLEAVSISSIDCGATACEIALSGSDPNPRYVGAYSELSHKLFAGPWNDFHIRSGGLGTREIAPGAREYVISFDYQPFVDLSADPLIAARQYAACAAFWRRQTEFPTPDDIVRAYLETAERYVTLAASVLGEQEATLVAAETRGGPLMRGCYLL